MFLGHFGVALAAKKVAPRTSLGLLVAAGECLDLLWPVLLLTGVEHVRIAKGITAVTPFDFYDYPISHSLATALLWGALAAALYFAFTRYARGFGAGLLLYVRNTRPKNTLGRYLIWLWAAVLVGSWLSTISGEPPNASAIAWLSLSVWLLVVWAAWADANRSSVTPSPH